MKLLTPIQFKIGYDIEDYAHQNTTHKNDQS